jgi:MoxR-like ATPase
MPAKTKTQPAATQAPMADIRTRLLQAEHELGDAVLEREAPIRSMVQALLTRQHVLLLGPPGTAKSYLTLLVTALVDGAECFSHQLTRTTMPDELFGSWDISKITTGQMERISMGGTMRSAHVAYLDEVFKANSTTLNALLGTLNERTFRNGTAGVEHLPLVSCVGTSNEYPQGDDLGALYDRFLLRHWIGYVQEETSWTELVLGGSRPNVSTRITLAELERAQADVQLVNLPQSLGPVLLSIRAALAQVGIQASDRRWRTAMGVVRAAAWLDGRAEASKADLLSLVNVLWNEHETEARKVNEVLLETCAPKLKELLSVMDLAYEQVRMLRDYSHRDDVTRGQITEAKQAFSQLQLQAEALVPDAGPQGAREAKRLAEYTIEAAKLHGASSW